MKKKNQNNNHRSRNVTRNVTCVTQLSRVTCAGVDPVSPRPFDVSVHKSVLCLKLPNDYHRLGATRLVVYLSLLDPVRPLRIIAKDANVQDDRSSYLYPSI